jgi:hypothetical protein
MSTTILDAEGNEHPLEMGDLVRHKDNPGRIGRVTRIDLDTDRCYVDYVCLLSDNQRSHLASQLVLVTKEPHSDDKEPRLHERRGRLIANLRSAVDRAQSEYDRALLQRLDYLLCPSLRDPRRWFWASVAESLDNPQQVSYAAKMEWMDNDTRRFRCSITKFLKKPSVREMCGEGYAFTDEEAKRVGELFGNLMPTDYNYAFEVVSGDEVSRTYNEEYFGSCMHDKPYTRWYDENPDSVQLVRITQGGNLAGRALLWTTTTGEKVLDRVYPSNGGRHIDAVHDLARQQGWDYKLHQNFHDGQLASDRMDYVVQMKASSSGDYPYCDTFKYTDDDPEDCEFIYLNMQSGEYCFNEQDGGYQGQGGRYTCCHCNDRISEDDVHSNGDHDYCQSCFSELYVYLDYQGRNQYREGDYYRDDTRCCERCDEHRYREDFTEVEGETVCLPCYEEDATHCSHCDEDVWAANTHSTHNEDVICDTCYSNGEWVRCEKCGLVCLKADLPLLHLQDRRQIGWCPTCLNYAVPAPPEPAAPALAIEATENYQATRAVLTAVPPSS